MPRSRPSPTAERRRLVTSLEEWATFRFERAAAHLRHISERALLEHVRLIDFAVLVVAADRTSISQSALGERVGLDRSTLSELLHALEDDGLVARAQNLSDRRQTSVEVTTSGRRTLESAAQALRRAEEAFLEPLTEQEREELREMLRVLEPPPPVLGDLYLLRPRRRDRGAAE